MILPLTSETQRSTAIETYHSDTVPAGLDWLPPCMQVSTTAALHQGWRRYAPDTVAPGFRRMQQMCPAIGMRRSAVGLVCSLEGLRQ